MAKLEQKNCKFCGKQFRTDRNVGIRAQIFCSIMHQSYSHNLKKEISAREKFIKFNKKNKTDGPLKCKFCFSNFFPLSPFQIKYCDKVCGKIGRAYFWHMKLQKRLRELYEGS